MTDWKDIKVTFTADQHQWLAVDPPRPISPTELTIATRLLSVPFPLRDEILREVEDAMVEERCKHCPTVSFRLPSTPPILVDEQPVYGAVPYEVVARDDDGMPVMVLLILSRGHVSTLDINRGDGKRLERIPNPTEAEVRPVGQGIPPAHRTSVDDRERRNSSIS